MSGFFHNARLYAVVLHTAFALASVHSAHAADRTQSLVGTPVGQVLDNLRPQGLTFIYNTRLIPSSLRVESEPTAKQGLALAEEILAPHGLAASRVTAGVFAVIHGTQQIESPRISSEVREARPEEIVVQASRYALRSEFSVEQTLLTHDDIQNLPSLAEEPLRSVQRLPGVASNGFSSLNSIRGGEPNETAIVLDGLRLYEPFHLKNFLSPISLLDSRFIESIQVYSGGFPVVHGDRMSGIIDAQTVTPTEPRYYEAGLSLFHTNVLASAQFDDRNSGVVSLRRSNMSELAQFSEEDFGKPEYFDGFAKLEHRSSDTTRWSAQFLGSKDRVVALRDSGQRTENEYRNAYLWSTLEHDWASGSQTRLMLSYTDIENERDGRVEEPARRSGRVHDNRSFHVIGLKADHDVDAWGLQHRLGLEARRLWGSYDYRSALRFEAGFPFPNSPPMEMQRVANPKPDGFEAGAWWDAQLKLNDRFTVQGGLRIDTQTYDASGDDEQVAPRFNVLYELNDATRIRASWGRFYQSHAINELPVEDGVRRFFGAQYSDQLILSLDRELREGVDLRIEAYRKRYQQVHQRFENAFDPLVLLPEMEFDRIVIDPVGARTEGVELFLRWESQEAWRAWIGYTWSRARDSIDGHWVPRSWDQEHAINAGVSWARGPWSVTVINSFHTGWPMTKLELREDANGDLQPVVGERNVSRFANYNSLDVRVNRTYALPRGALDIYFEATNLFSRENPCCIEYEVTAAPDGSPVIDAELDYWLPLVPSIGVLWRY